MVRLSIGGTLKTNGWTLVVRQDVPFSAMHAYLHCTNISIRETAFVIILDRVMLPSSIIQYHAFDQVDSLA